MDDVKRITTMYIVATQFKNAIPDPKNSMLDLDFHKHIYPYIVNKSFACEVYLKIIITANGDEIPRNHNIKDLYKLSGIEDEFHKITLSIYGDEIAKDIDNCIESFSNAFIQWRYIYEQDSTGNLMYGFLKYFVEYLNMKCKTIIQEKYNYDVNSITTFL